MNGATSPAAPEAPAPEASPSPTAPEAPAAPEASPSPAAPEAPAAPVASPSPPAPVASSSPAAPATSPSPAAPATSPSPVAPATSPSPAAPVASSSPAAPATSPSPVAPTASRSPVTAPSTSSRAPAAVPSSSSELLPKPGSVLAMLRPGSLHIIPPFMEVDEKSTSDGSDTSFTSSYGELPAVMGLLTSESPDAVKAWQGRPRERLYGRPKLAGDPKLRVLVMPPVYTMWVYWILNDDELEKSLSNISEIEGVKPLEDFKMRVRKKSSHPRPQGLEFVERSTYKADTSA